MLLALSAALAVTPSITMGTDPSICMKGRPKPGMTCVQSDSWEVTDAAGVTTTWHWVSREPTPAEEARDIGYRYGLADASGRVLFQPVWDGFSVIAPGLFYGWRDNGDGYERKLLSIGGVPRDLPETYAPWVLSAESPNLYFVILEDRGEVMDVAAIRPDGSYGPTLTGVEGIVRYGDIAIATVVSPPR